MTATSLPTAAAALSGLLLATAASAAPQWSTDTDQNQVVAAAASDQNQPKVARATDGGYWVSWFDGIGSGWDVRLQRFDVDGNAMLGAGGLLVADRSFSSTQDYGLDVGLNGDALLVFRDDRGGSTEITAARITPGGARVYGPGGLTLSTGAGFVAAPKITRGRDLTFVCWTENSSVRTRTIDASGGPGTLDLTWTPAVGSYLLSDLRSVGQDAVVSFVHQTGGFSSPRHLLAQRVTPSGALPWGPAPLAVFDGGSLQFGNFPSFAVNSSGDSVFSWYSSSPALQSFVQRVSPDGVERFPHNGVAVAVAPGRVRVSPSAVYDEFTEDIVVAWREQNSAQSMSGLSLQRVDATGQRLWGDSGVAVRPLGSSVTGRPVPISVAPQGDTLVVWEQEPTFGMDQILGARLNDQGAVTLSPFDVAGLPSPKARLTGAAGLLEGALLAWSDGRSDSGDIYAQQIDFDGTPGDSGVFSTPSCAAVPNSTGQVGQTFVAGDPIALSNRVSLAAIGLPQNAFSFFITSPMSGFTPQAGGSLGNLCLGGAIGRFVGPGQIRNTQEFGSIQLQLDLTMHPTPTGLVAVTGGETWYFQAWHRDTGPMGTASNFSAAARATFQ